MKPQPLPKGLAIARADRPLRLCPLVLFALLAAGCQGGVTSTRSGQSDPAVATSSTGSTSPKTNAALPPENSTGSDRGALPAIPAELQTEAYHWYGLANDKPINVEMTSTNGSPTTGSQVAHLKSVEKGKAVFDVERMGDYGAQLGTDVITLKKDGIYATNTLMKTDKPELELPSNLSVGTSWKNKSKVEMSGKGTVQQDITLKVVGEQQVSTKAGTQRALLIVATGKMSIGADKYRMEVRQWYVKDKGLVKNVIRLYPVANPKAKPQEVTIQETKS